MRVHEYLELEAPSVLLDRACASWSSWGEADPRLRVLGSANSLELDELRAWVDAAEPPAVDEVLHALATLAATDGGDNPAAAALLAWVLLPGAYRLAHQLRDLGLDTRRMVAAQLWIQVRTFKWRQLRKVAANVMRDTRTGCLREAGKATRVDRAWAATELVDPASVFWDQVTYLTPAGSTGGAAAVSGPASSDELREAGAQAELADLLRWALDNDVITRADCEFLACVLEEAEALSPSRRGRSLAGLTGRELSERVAPRCGVAQATVRRRVRLTVRALAEAAGRYSA